MHVNRWSLGLRTQLVGRPSTVKEKASPDETISAWVCLGRKWCWGNDYSGEAQVCEMKIFRMQSMQIFIHEEVCCFARRHQVLNRLERVPR
jgi:hypothetical protein